MAGECKQKRASTRRPPVRRQSITELLESGGFDWAVRAIYQINRGGSDSRRMMGPTRRASGLHMSGSDQVSASRPPWRAKRDGSATCVAHGERGSWHTHAGHAISKPAVDREYRVIAPRCPQYASVAFPKRMRTSAFKGDVSSRDRPRHHHDFAIGTQFARVLSHGDDYGGTR